MRRQPQRPRCAAALIAVAWFAAAFALPGAPASAAGVSPYAPLNLAPELERDLERVLILANQPVMRRPIPLGLVAAVLPQACHRDAGLCKRVRRYLQRAAEAGLTLAEAELAAAKRSGLVSPNRHGAPADGAWLLAASGYLQPSNYFLASAGAVVDPVHATPTGSVLSAGFHSMQLDVGYRDHWSSPLTDSSMLISTEAPTMPSITVSNWEPLTRWGLGYEVFLAKMSRSDHIGYGNGLTSGSPRLAGLQLGATPAPGWSVGVNRLLQFGGGQRGGNSLRDVLRALFNPHGSDNAVTGAVSSPEEGNQLASLTTRMLFQGRTPFAVYGEFAGEDTSHGSNFRLGNAAVAVGIDLPLLPHGLDATYEVTEWQDGWYVHHIYQDGLRNRGEDIGNWFGDWRIPGDGVGGQQHMLRLGWHRSAGRELALRYRTMTNAAYSSHDYRRAQELTLDVSRPWRGVRIGATVDAGRDVFGDDFARLAGFVRFDDVDTGAGLAETAGDAAPATDTTDAFVDVGASTGRIGFQSSAKVPDVTTGGYHSPHLGLGARRVVSAHDDLGVRVEWDRFNGASLLALRAFDYRRRWGRHLAASAFLGVARLDTGLPAFGYYLGAGLQWRNALARTDLNVDVRHGDKLARDALLPGDPPTTARPDMFYTLDSVAAYLSFHF